jgi:TonB-dependent starch-binding outer membrane protein SusC
VHKEEFFKNIKQVSNLKLRLSTGITGNQAIDPYSSIGKLSTFRYTFGNGVGPISASNPNLKWEKTWQTDFGFDLELFNNRIGIVADFYYKKTTDLLLNAPVPGTSGLSFYDPNTNLSQFSLIAQNIGEVENKGIEIALLTQNIVNTKFTWNSQIVFSKNESKILSLGDGIDQIVPNIQLPSVLQVGAPVGSFLVYQTDGLIQPNEAGANALTPSGNKKAGGQKYKDINGDGVITQAGDRVVIVNQPGINLGFTNTITYKTKFGTFDATVFLQSTIGGKLYNQNRAQLELNTGYNNGTADVVNAYRAPGTRGASDLGNTKTDVKAAYQDPAITISDRFIEDASYVRLKNLTVGYTLPNEWLERAKIKKIRVYGSAQNIATITSYTGFDPEASQQNQSLIYKGIDNGVYPNSKSLLVGVNLTF